MFSIFNTFFELVLKIFNRCCKNYGSNVPTGDRVMHFQEYVAKIFVLYNDSLVVQVYNHLTCCHLQFFIPMYEWNLKVFSKQLNMHGSNVCLVSSAHLFTVTDLRDGTYIYKVASVFLSTELGFIRIQCRPLTRMLSRTSDWMPQYLIYISHQNMRLSNNGLGYKYYPTKTAKGEVKDTDSIAYLLFIEI